MYNPIEITSYNYVIAMAMTVYFRNRFIGGTYHICLAYVLSLNFREYPHKIGSHMVRYLQFKILKFPLIILPVCPGYK